MPSHFRIVSKDVNGDFETLRDILPDASSPMGVKLNMLIVAKRPAPESVAIGHYFQGFEANQLGKRAGHGPMFWKQLRDYGIMHVPLGKFDDECLLDHGYGIIDMVKRPAPTGCEPTNEEYRAGVERVLQIIRAHEPHVILFTYKPPLEQILRIKFRASRQINYGFNTGLEGYFNARVFLCPLPGVGGATREDIQGAMNELKIVMKT